MKHFIKAAVVASAMLVASQAQAADYVINDASNVFVTTSVTATSIQASITTPVIPGSAAAPQNFTDTYTFQLPFSGFGSGSVTSSFSNIAIDNQLTFTSAVLNIYDNVTNALFATIPGTISSNGFSISAAIAGGIPQDFINVITVNGISSGGGYGGVLRAQALPAVPEPSTWAMLLAGFGAVGFAMRRRSSQSVKVSFA